MMYLLTSCFKHDSFSWFYGINIKEMQNYEKTSKNNATTTTLHTTIYMPYRSGTGTHEKGTDAGPYSNTCPMQTIQT